MHPPSDPTPLPAGTPQRDVPVLRSERLTLRAPALNDLPALCRMWANPKVVKYIGARPRSRSEVWTTMQRSLGCWYLLGYGFWTIAETDSGEVLGEIGFLEGLRDLTPPHAGTPEAGWCLDELAWGQGYASEALAAVVTWADSHLNCARTICIIDQGNVASAAVAQKNGYSFNGNAELGGDTVATYVRPNRG